MSSEAKLLSKRSSMWESTFNLSNYTRPQGWANVDYSHPVTENLSKLTEVVQSVCLDRYSMELESADLENLVKYVQKQSVGYPMTYNRLNRLVGQWLVHEFNPTQDQYEEGYQSLSS